MGIPIRKIALDPTPRHPRLMAAVAVLAIVLSQGPSAMADKKAHTAEAEDPDLEWGPCPAFMPEGCEIAALQGDPAEPNADVFFKLPGETTAPEHWHTSAERMVLVAGEMQVTYEGQDAVALAPGTYAYGPPELPHTAECVSAEPCVLFIAFEEPVDAFEAD